MSTEYVVRIENCGDLEKEIDCDGLHDAALTARDLQAAYPHHTVDVYRPDNIDLGMPTGLTRDEREQVEEWMNQSGVGRRLTDAELAALRGAK